MSVVKGATNGRSFIMAGQPIAKPIKIEVNIKPGPATLAQRAAWRRLWAKLIAEVKAGEH